MPIFLFLFQIIVHNFETCIAFYKLLVNAQFLLQSLDLEVLYRLNIIRIFSGLYSEDEGPAKRTEHPTSSTFCVGVSCISAIPFSGWILLILTKVKFMRV